MEEGDFIIFTLDLVSKTLKCTTDFEYDLQSDIKVADDIQYKFALQMRAVGNSVTLTNFQIIHNVDQC